MKIHWKGREEDLREDGWTKWRMVSNGRDCRLMKCATVLHWGHVIVHRPHIKVGIRRRERKRILRSRTPIRMFQWQCKADRVVTHQSTALWSLKMCMHVHAYGVPRLQCTTWTSRSSCWEGTSRAKAGSPPLLSSRESVEVTRRECLLA